jgi:putative inorganic carbon (hco3(-)) transporter
MLGLLFTYSLTYLGAIAALFNPFIGLLVYICFAILKPESLWPWSVPAGNYSRIVAIATLIGWMFREFGDWKLGRARGILVAIVGLLFWSILSALFAPDQGVAWLFVDGLSKIVVPFVVGLSLIKSAVQLKQIAWVISLCHGYLAFEFNQMFYSGQFIRGEFSFAGMEEGSISIGMICATGFSFLYGLSQKTLWKKILLLGVTVLTGHVVLFSFTRGGILGLLASLLVAFLVSNKDPKTLLAIGLALLLGLRLAGPEVRDRFATTFVGSEERDASSQSRLDLWSACCQTMMSHPILGIGPDHWTVTGNQEFNGQIALFSKKKEAHTLWLQIGAELGLPGLLTLMSFYFICVGRLWPLTRRVGTGSNPQHDTAAEIDQFCGYGACMVIVPICGFMVAAQFISLEFLEVPYYITLVGAGILKLSSAPLSSLREPIGRTRHQSTVIA